MSDDTRVLFNADCPVCNYEISHYASYSAEHGLAIRFDDLNDCDLARYGVDKDAAARRLHVLDDGQVYAGIDAFLALWRRMPRYRPLARIVGLPVIRQLAAAVYDYILAPALYARHRRRVMRLQSADRTP
jgi:predicted DCC family thiol-disulfide oxidoreductase YuxK